jgi:dTDP-glucose pyrophosphorylase
MAGAGTRFKEAGYTDPKPLISVNGCSMAGTAVKNIRDGRNLGLRFHLVCNSKEVNLEEAQTAIWYAEPVLCKMHDTNGLTDGPARTALIADIDPYFPLIIVNCDQVIHDFNLPLFLEFAEKTNADGVIGCFISTSPKNSYVRLNDDGEVCEVREKEVISNMATNGLHYWRRGGDFIESANAMIEAGDKQAGEYYIAPTYNYLISQGKKILPYFFNLHYPIGTPEDLQRYQQLYGSV